MMLKVYRIFLGFSLTLALSIVMTSNAFASSSGWVAFYFGENEVELTVIDQETGKELFTCARDCRKKIKNVDILDFRVTTDGQTMVFKTIPVADLGSIFGFHYLAAGENPDDEGYYSPPYNGFAAAPKMPRRAKKSGLCNADLKLNAEGIPTSAEITGCTHQILAEPSYYSIAMTRFHIPPEDRETIGEMTFQIKRTFVLTDSRGNVIQ